MRNVTQNDTLFRKVYFATTCVTHDYAASPPMFTAYFHQIVELFAGTVPCSHFYGAGFRGDGQYTNWIRFLATWHVFDVFVTVDVSVLSLGVTGWAIKRCYYNRDNKFKIMRYKKSGFSKSNLKVDLR